MEEPDATTAPPPTWLLPRGWPVDAIPGWPSRTGCPARARHSCRLRSPMKPRLCVCDRTWNASASSASRHLSPRQERATSMALRRTFGLIRDCLPSLGQRSLRLADDRRCGILETRRTGSLRLARRRDQGSFHHPVLLRRARAFAATDRKSPGSRRGRVRGGCRGARAPDPAERAARRGRAFGCNRLRHTAAGARGGSRAPLEGLRCHARSC